MCPGRSAASPNFTAPIIISMPASAFILKATWLPSFPFLRRYDGARDGIWLALADGRIEGSIAIDGVEAGAEGAHLRWFIVSDALRGNGAGGKLISTALDFCRVRKYRTVYLWTFEGLNAARHLYEKHGFRMTRQQRGKQWGSEVNEQRFECHLPE